MNKSIVVRPQDVSDVFLDLRLTLHQLNIEGLSYCLQLYHQPLELTLVSLFPGLD